MLINSTPLLKPGIGIKGYPVQIVFRKVAETQRESQTQCFDVESTAVKVFFVPSRLELAKQKRA